MPARTWRHVETLAGYLKELGIFECRVNAAAFELRAAAGLQDDKRRAAASERMTRNYRAAAQDTWFRQQVQASIDDTKAGVDGAPAKAQFPDQRTAWPQRTDAENWTPN